MQFTFNAKGYELAVAFQKKRPGPAVLVAQDNMIHVNDVAEAMRFVQQRDMSQDPAPYVASR